MWKLLLLSLTLYISQSSSANEIVQSTMDAEEASLSSKTLDSEERFFLYSIFTIAFICTLLQLIFCIWKYNMKSETRDEGVQADAELGIINPIAKPPRLAWTFVVCEPPAATFQQCGISDELLIVKDNQTAASSDYDEIRNLRQNQTKESIEIAISEYDGISTKI